MEKNKILNITIPADSKKSVLEKIKKYIKKPAGFCHVVSLNPENLVIARKDKVFEKIIETAQIKIIDGQWIVIAGRILGIQAGERLTGVDLMKNILELSHLGRLRVMLIGGKPNLADKLANCYNRAYPKAEFLGMEGVKNIKDPTATEEKTIVSIVADYKPHIVLAAFGSPEQEIWLDRHQDLFKNCLVMGVGGAFDFLSGEVPRAPEFIRKIGFEWLYRLIRQPWRWRRQLRLIEFVCLVFKQKIGRLDH